MLPGVGATIAQLPEMVGAGIVSPVSESTVDVTLSATVDLVRNDPCKELHDVALAAPPVDRHGAGRQGGMEVLRGLHIISRHDASSVSVLTMRIMMMQMA